MLRNFHFLPCLLLLAGFLVPTTNTFGQDELPSYKEKILNQKNALAKLAPTALLEPVTGPLSARQKATDRVQSGTYFRINPTGAASLRAKSSLRLQLPTAGGKDLDLQLVPAEVFSEGFAVYLGSDRSQPLDYTRARFYWGIVAGHPESAAAISVTDGEVAGVISVDGVTYNLGRMEDKNTDLHILYRSDDLNEPPMFGCFADELADQTPASTKLEGGTNRKGADNCVKMYVEVDYDITVGKGGVTEAADYVTAVFNQVAIMYANDAVNVKLNELVVWDVPDPYNGDTSRDFLYAFRDQLNGEFNGDLAHLVGYAGGGGVAYLNQLCGSLYRVGYSGIRSTFNLVPQYSWTVEVVTHEIGHNLGSSHTHACVWNGNGTAIDGCGPAAGYNEGCDGPVPNKGTVMSYCHLVSGVGIDLALGFGPQPKALIQDRVYNRSCLSPCAPPAANDAAITAITAPTGSICAPAIAPTVTLQNYGTNALTSVTIDYQIDGGAVVSTNWTGNLASGASSSVNLNGTTVSAGSHTIVAVTNNPNGGADEGSGSDSASGNFTLQSEQTFYRDGDGDGFGDPAQSLTDCNAPAGYVSDNTDCNDGDGTAYPGAPCSTDACLTGESLDANCNCSGGNPAADSDNDGVCDPIDVCPGGDDNLDTNNDGVPDFCDCNEATTTFSVASLTHSGNGSSSTSVTFGSDSKDPSFTISGLDARLSGNRRNRYEERVTVTYVDGNGNSQTYGTFNGGTQASGTVTITGPVQSVTVQLSDGYDGSAPGTLAIDLGQIDYCAPFVTCPDADGDGVCDADDSCPGLDDGLIGQPCDDGDNCTENDVYGSDCGCAGTPVAGCVSCDNPFTNFFGADPLQHSGGGSSTTTVDLGGTHTNASFTISGMSARTGGKPANRFSDEVSVSYVDGNGNTVAYGSYSGASQSSVSVDIAGPVQRITVSLSNGQSSSVSQSINLSEVSSCGTAALIAGTTTITPVALFPNPTSARATLRLGAYVGETVVVVRNTLGAVVRRYRVQDAPALMLDTQSWAGSQVYLVTVYRGDERPVTKRLVVNR